LLSLLQGRGEVIHERRHKGAPSGPMRSMHVMPEGIGKPLAALVPMQILKDAVAFSGIGRQVNEAHVLPSMDALPCLFHVLCQRDFPRAQE
jgi:hypothetical protein